MFTIELNVAVEVVVKSVGAASGHRPASQNIECELQVWDAFCA